jgi:hypothetical protein
MAASTLTFGDWTVGTKVGKTSVWSCTITATTADYDIYTKKTPKDLDPHKPWTLFVNTASATLDDTVAAIPVDLYIGFGDSFALTENNAPVVAGGVLYKADIYDDVRTAIGAIQMHPNLMVAEDVAGVAAKCYVPIAPYYIFNLDCASALSAGSCTFKIVQ